MYHEKDSLTYGGTCVGTYGGGDRVRTCAGGLAFRLDCVPPTATAQQKGACVRGGRVRFYTKARVSRDADFLAALLLPHRPPAPFAGPVSFEAVWTFPWRKSERKSAVAAGVPLPHASRPDLDNLEKLLLDVMTRLRFWTDDSLVAEKRTAKFRGPRPGIWIQVRPAGGFDFGADGGENR